MYLILYQNVQQYIISTKLKYLHKKYFHSLLFNTKIKKEKKYIKKNKNIYTKKISKLISPITIESICIIFIII